MPLDYIYLENFKITDTHFNANIVIVLRDGAHNVSVQIIFEVL
jgi:hypothetical protein